MNTTRPSLFAPLALGTALLCSQAAQAQAQAINKCMIDGLLVYQAKPCALEPRTSAASAPAPIAVASANPSAPKKKTLADVLRERDGSVPSPAAPREPQGDGANLLRSRMGAL
jgi:hypothetical protein